MLIGDRERSHVHLGYSDLIHSGYVQLVVSVEHGTRRDEQRITHVGFDASQSVAFETAELPFYAKATELSRSIGVDTETFKKANPGLRTTVWNGPVFPCVSRN